MCAGLPAQAAQAVHGSGLLQLTSLYVSLQALAPWVPGYVELGPLYKLYMVGVTVFATNAINILAGVNGLEVQPLLLQWGVRRDIQLFEGNFNTHMPKTIVSRLANQSAHSC